LFICLGWAAPAAHGETVLVYGDSLSAAYGIPERSGWVALLGERLQRERPNYSVANASISGETTAGGLVRFGKALEQHRPAIVILELGANDGLRGLPMAAMKKNLATMIGESQRAGAKVLLVGVRLPPNYGEAYTRTFAQVYADLAKQYRTALVPFLFEGFGEKMDFFQADHMHPTAAAQPLLLNNVWVPLAPLLRKK
jgi:acyl-CoA thioesterase I